MYHQGLVFCYDIGKEKFSAEDHALKKILMTAGIILVIAALVCFGLSVFFDHLGGSVMDASNEFYHNTYLRYLLFRNCGTGLAAAGVICLVIRILFR